MQEKNYLEVNKEAWNKKTAIHVDSAFYDNKTFIEGRNTLNDIELALLGDIKGKTILHLQCHFGQDSISLSRMGAEVTGVDLSDKAIEKARELAELTGSKAEFICCDVYDLPNHLNQTYDLVFTSYGTIGWLPDLNKWGAVVARFLKPGGKFIMAEFHPFIWAFDNDFQEIAYHYFNAEPIIEIEKGTYADQKSDLVHEYITWNHPISEVLNALIGNGLNICSFNEFDYSPYNCFKHTLEFEPNKFRIDHFGAKMPMVYSLEATF